MQPFVGALCPKFVEDDGDLLIVLLGQDVGEQSGLAGPQLPSDDGDGDLDIGITLSVNIWVQNKFRTTIVIRVHSAAVL